MTYEKLYEIESALKSAVKNLTNDETRELVAALGFPAKYKFKIKLIENVTFHLRERYDGKLKNRWQEKNRSSTLARRLFQFIGYPQVAR